MDLKIVTRAGSGTYREWESKRKKVVLSSSRTSNFIQTLKQIITSIWEMH